MRNDTMSTPIVLKKQKCGGAFLKTFLHQFSIEGLT
jgi:hypothetical protein